VQVLVTTGLRDELRKLVPMALAGIALGIASAIIVLDHPVEPLDTPLPVIDPAPLVKIARADRETRARIDKAPLPAEIRAVGSSFLEWNATAARGIDPRDPRRDELAREIRSALGVARSKAGGEEQLATQLQELRAYHADLFIDELRRRVRANTMSEELKRLGGPLVDVLVRNGWLATTGELRAPESIVRARYKLHWTSIVYTLEDCEGAPAPVCYGLTTLPLDPIELRSLLAYLIAHPVVREEDALEAGSAERAVERRRIVYVERLAALDRYADPTGATHPYLANYPVDLARGVLLYRLGRYDLATEQLRAYAAVHRDDGRARNWYLGALAKIRGD
jgi:hypothetical protein